MLIQSFVLFYCHSTRLKLNHGEHGAHGEDQYLMNINYLHGSFVDACTCLIFSVRSVFSVVAIAEI
jgi:hypothetical protein